MLGRIDIHKEANISSFGVVARIRKIMDTRRCGHSGTLDPMAEGVLSVYVGRATSFIDRLRTQSKCYTGTLRFGYRSDTQDIWGAVEKIEAPIPSLEEIERILPAFTGEIWQTPPMVSALKVEGKPLYKYAREGKTLERAQRKVRIDSIELLGAQAQEALFSIRCSKGTYIRTLFTDIASALGSEGVMSSLIRTENDGIHLDDCFTLPQIEQMMQEGDLSFLREPGSLQPFEKAELSEKLYEDWKSGRKNKLPAHKLKNPRILLTYQHAFVGTALKNGDFYYPEKVI